MAFIYEVNGQQVEFDQEPTAADIDEAARSLGPAAAATGVGLATETAPTESTAVENLAQQAGTNAAARIAPAAIQGTAQFAKALPGNILSEVASLGQVAGKIGFEGVKTLGQQMAKTPVDTTLGLAKAYLQGHGTWGKYLEPLAGKTVPQVAGMAGRTLASGIGGAIVAPESAFLYPYNMAAYEQAKIRQNPTAPGLEYNPYAQTVRGQAATQGQAGSANQMRTVANMPYGNVSLQERARLDEDAKMKEDIRKKAYERAMGINALATAPQRPR
jgi:hypothetical protein